jgi:hypothetical protein
MDEGGTIIDYDKEDSKRLRATSKRYDSKEWNSRCRQFQIKPGFRSSVSSALGAA